MTPAPWQPQGPGPAALPVRARGVVLGVGRDRRVVALVRILLVAFVAGLVARSSLVGLVAAILASVLVVHAEGVWDRHAHRSGPDDPIPH